MNVEKVELKFTIQPFLAPFWLLDQNQQVHPLGLSQPYLQKGSNRIYNFIVLYKKKSRLKK